MLQYTLCVSRVAHYLKVMGRDKIGGYQDAESLERDFQRWLHQYTTASDEASDELRAKYPLNEAKITVREKRENSWTLLLSYPFATAFSTRSNGI